MIKFSLKKSHAVDIKDVLLQKKHAENRSLTTYPIYKWIYWCNRLGLKGEKKGYIKPHTADIIIMFRSDFFSPNSFRFYSILMCSSDSLKHRLKFVLHQLTKRDWENKVWTAARRSALHLQWLTEAKKDEAVCTSHLSLYSAKQHHSHTAPEDSLKHHSIPFQCWLMSMSWEKTLQADIGGDPDNSKYYWQY